jgi:hypothetical protein
MRTLLKVLFFILVLFHANISGSKTIVFEGLASEIKHTASDVGIKNDSKPILENDFGISCKSGCDLVDYRNWATSAISNAAKGGASLWPAASGGRTVVNGIEYTTHALERMQPVGTIMKGTTIYSRGIPPSVVENAIKSGKITPGNTAAEVVRTFDNVRVITNPAGSRVISVFKIGN